MKGVIMKKAPCLFTLLFAAFSLSNAQGWTPFLKVDTVTTGEFDDSHPVVYHSVPNSEMEIGPWMVFERRSSTESMIAAKRFVHSSLAWDTSITIISSGPISGEQSIPDIAMIPYYSSSRIVSCSLAAWQEKTDSVWNIYYSTVFNDSSQWTDPIPLTSGTTSNSMVHVSPYQDSTFIVTWKNNNVILYSLISPTMTAPPETLAVSNYDSFDYDFAFAFDEGGVVWTEHDTAGTVMLVERSISTYPTFSLAIPETLNVSGNISNPRFPSYFVSLYYPSVLYESSLGGRHSIYLLSGMDTMNISNDPNADYRNARVFSSPVITKTLAKSTYLPFQFLVVERTSPGDSALLFEQSVISRDTVRSTGYNRYACIGSWSVSFPQSGYPCTPIVWESNRSGRSHIYSRFVVMPSESVPGKIISVNNFQLSQNYPNPFNPSTVIHFHLSSTAAVTLKIFDILGRELQTLVEQNLTEGDYSAEWDGTRFASGVYFYRLQAGTFVQTKKLLLLK